MPEQLPQTTFEESLYQDNQDMHEFGLNRQILQEYGRRAAGMLLASSVVLGLTSCEPGDQTLPIGMETTEKVLKITGSQVVTGSCTQSKQTIKVGSEEREQTYSRCNARADDLRRQSVAQVSEASNGGKAYTIAQTEKDCTGPGQKFVATLSLGDVIGRGKRNYRKFDEDGKTVADEEYCVWSKK